MRIHYLQHVDFEDPAYILHWAKDSGHTVTCTRLFLNDPFPEVDEIDWLLIMGGPMSVNDETRYKWIKPEKQFIERCMTLDRKVIGFCLGAQMIASILGSRIYPNHFKEIGWFPVKVSLGETKLQNLFPSEFNGFHWHGETFDVPKLATLFASSEACPNQAFHYGNNVWAFQFHLEILQHSVENLIRNCPEDLTPGTYVQSASAMLTSSSGIDSLHSILKGFLQFLSS